MSLYTDSQLQYIIFAGTAVYPMLHSTLANASTACTWAFNMQSQVYAVSYYPPHSMSTVQLLCSFAGHRHIFIYLLLFIVLETFIFIK